MTKVSAKETLWDAERLAQFSNAATEADIDYFRLNYGDFFPRNFWNWQVRVREAGEFVFSSVPLTREIIQFSQAFLRALQEAWQVGFPLEECVRLISCAVVPDRLSGATDVEPDLSSYPVWPYQRAMMLLAVEPWRARFCAKCGKRFVADKPARRFCSTRCSSSARRQSKKVWWTDKGEKWRADHEKKRAKAKGKSERSRRKRR